LYSLSSAAKATGKSKGTISEAIRSGKISASKDAHGQWSIDPAEIHRVYPPVQPEQSSLDPSCTSSGPSAESFSSDHDELVQLLKESLADAKRERDDARAERDHWRGLAMDFKTQLALPSGQPPRRRGFFARLFGNAN
jgi:hypothetical protein